VTPNKKELGVAYKRDAKAVADALEGLGEEDAMCLKVRRRSGGGRAGRGRLHAAAAGPLGWQPNATHS
jgi:hypothetical protein